MSDIGPDPYRCVDEIEVYRTTYWSGAAGTWTGGNAWTTAGVGGASTTPFPGDQAAFVGQTGSPQLIALGDGNRSTRALTVATSDPVSISAGGTDRTLTLGWAGDLTSSSTATNATITVGGAAGSVTIGSQTAGERVALALNASQTWKNDSTNDLTVENTVARVATDATSRVLTVAGVGSTTIAGAIADGGSAGTLALAKSGSGVLTLSGSNTFTGGVRIDAGVVHAANASALGNTGPISFGGGTLRFSSGNTTDYSTRFSTAANQAYAIDTNGEDVTLAGNLSSSGGSLSKGGAGKLTLTGSNTLAGGFAINAGVLAVGGSAALGTTGVISFGGGTLQFSPGNTTDYSGRFSASAGQNYAIDTNGQDVTLTGSLTSAGGSLRKIGPGSLSLAGSNSYDAGTVVAGGRLLAPQAGIGGGTVTVGAGGRFDIEGGRLANDLVLEGGTIGSFGLSIPTDGPSIPTGGSFSSVIIAGTAYGLNVFTTTGIDSFAGYSGPVDVLVVGGGGGGGSRFGGGGGAGGVIYEQGVVVTSPVPVTVGQGGAGGAASGGSGTFGASPGSNGQSSAFGDLTALGGGGGAAGDQGGGLAGGSGGGAAGRFAGTGGAGTEGQGFNGGSFAGGGSSYRGGGGGGAGGVGGAAGANGEGGIGRIVSITGASNYFGGGGGGGGSGDEVALQLSGGVGGLGGGGAGGNYTGTPAAVAGLPNSGGGGGGGAYLGLNLNNQAGADGGSGVVIVRYELAPEPARQTLSGSVVISASSTLDARLDGAGFELTGPITGVGGLTIVSSAGHGGRVIFSGAAKNYQGPTLVDAGAELHVNSDNSAATGAIAVNGRLAGSGVLGGAVTINSGGVFAPGTSIESLGTGALSFADGAVLEYEVNSSALLSVGADFTRALGGLSLLGTVDLSLIDLAASPEAFDDGTTFTLVNYTGSWNQGLFSVAGSPVVNGGTFTVGLNTWRLDYAAGSGGANFTADHGAGNFVNIVAVPEPAGLMIAVAGLALGLFRRVPLGRTGRLGCPHHGKGGRA